MSTKKNKKTKIPQDVRFTLRTSKKLNSKILKLCDVPKYSNSKNQYVVSAIREKITLDAVRLELIQKALDGKLNSSDFQKAVSALITSSVN